MNIKKSIKYSFILIAVLSVLLGTINSIVLIQMKGNEISSNKIAKLVYLEENMNSLLKDLIITNKISSLEKISNNFLENKQEFDDLKKSFIMNEKVDFLDMFIPDVHKNSLIKRHLVSLFRNEKVIENTFNNILALQNVKIELINTFNKVYALENTLRKKIENDIVETQNIKLIKSFINLKYYSKETIYEHKNNLYLNKWLNEVYLIKNSYRKKDLDEYIKVVKDVGFYVIKIKEIELTEISLENDILKVMNLNKNIKSDIQDILEKLSSNLIDKINLIIFILLIVIIGFISVFSYKVYKYVGLTVDEIEDKVERGLEEIKCLNHEIEITQKEVVFTMGAIGESRSKETGNHVKRVAEYSKLLALHYGLPKKEAEMLKQASPMHDIGKVAIPDSILNKPGRFDESERKIMDTHALLGYEMLKSSDRPLLKMAATVAYEHHEKYNGKGYPQGLKGEEIHIYGRITALSDVFDALGSDRLYKKAWSDEKIFNLFKEERGEHFDPKLIDIFFDNIDEFLKIRESLRDMF